MPISVILENFFFNQSTFQVVIQLLAIVIWTALAGVFLYAGLFLLRFYKEEKWVATWEWTMLAIDIPPMNVQTPKAVEQLFAHMYSIMEPPSIGFVYRRGFRQFSYSFEIVSIEGYIQFIIRTLTKYRDVVEAAIYAQYPEAEITEIEDYVNDMPIMYPNDTHQIFAADYVLISHWAYPIRTYQEFEHSISKDTVLKDPMGTFLESFTRIGEGEQVWFQLLTEPIEEKRWKNDVIKEVKKVIGEKNASKDNLVDVVAKASMKVFEEMGDQVFGREAGAAGADKTKNEPINKMLYLTPGQKKIVEAMEDKISKIGYMSKLRVVYAAEKDKYKASHAMNSITGALNQYTVPTSNGLLPKYLTSTEYMFANWRKDYRRRVLMGAYKRRDIKAGKSAFILNIEELATIWHFPMSHVKTPLVQKAAIKTAEPPIGLPVELSVEAGLIPGLGGVMEEAAEETKTEENAEQEKAKQQGYNVDTGEISYDDAVKFG